MSLSNEEVAALEGSIKNWEGIVAGKDFQDCQCCGLADSINDDDSTPCFGCPVFKYTGESYCEGTPYDDWYDATKIIGGRKKGAGTKELKQIAQRELNFLKEVLLADGANNRQGVAG